MTSLIWTVFDKSRAIIPKQFRQCGSFSNIVTKFEEYTMTTIWVIEQTRLKFLKFEGHNSRELRGIGWLLNLAKGLRQQTLPPSFMIIHWKILKEQSAQLLIWAIPGK